MGSRITQSQPSNFLTSSPCSVLLWTHVNDAMKALKCISVMGLEKLKFDKIMPMSSNNCFMVRRVKSKFDFNHYPNRKRTGRKNERKIIEKKLKQLFSTVFTTSHGWYYFTSRLPDMHMVHVKLKLKFNGRLIA